ncbi:MAG TPA: hypothetical protein DCR43_07965 [Bacteroidales bacterium]|nr:MAG: hypothetical protein A2X11_04915 [Bacteroidetes bacterium GWE2_42_24]OFY28443.1 MAG: hypothetical protein A2X09_13785 [Bacteroidetes bacterium GWF2_43_11]HAQ65769.1 hypothetical protein [Bacteroidales bacterium]HBZ65653.1 hypothetical protein [Bacteroidales bacterium]
MSTSSITPRILLVDDNPKNLQILISYLKNFQFHLDISTSGEDAFSSIATSKPDLILLDIMMPDMDGYEVCRRLKADPLTADIPIIFITALAEPENKIKGFQLGGVDYITKPFHKQEVMARIETQLTMIRQRQELLDLNIKLQSSNKMLEEANEAKDKLLTIIGHDLRGPIGNINNLLHLILENQLDGNDRNELLQETILSVQGTYFLLENLLFWAKSQRNEIEFYPEEVNLNELIVETIHSLQSTAVDKNIVVSSHLDDTDTVTGDSNMLAVVIRNLISNAIKFTSSGGTVVIETHLNQNHKLWVSVTDTGVGLSADQIEKLLTPGIHNSSRGTQNEKGTGVGLSLCSDFLRHHGSSLKIDSSPNKGSTFSFSLSLPE